MKNIILVMSILFVAFISNAACQGGSISVNAGNAQTIDIKSLVNSMVSGAFCNINWDDDMGSVAVEYHGSYYYAPLGTFVTGFIDMPGEGGIIQSSGFYNLQSATNWMYANDPSDMNSSDLTLKVTTILVTAIGNEIMYEITINVKHPGLSIFPIETLCSNKTYTYGQIVNSPPAYVSPILTFNTGEVFVGGTINFTQPPSNQLVLTYTCTINGLSCVRTLTKNIYKNPNAYFNSRPVGLNTTSNNVLLSPFCTNVYSSVLEFNGSGVMNIGGQFYLNPSSAGPGSHDIEVRGNNQGCISDWMDTVIQVAGVATMGFGPAINPNWTFGSGESWNILYHYTPESTDPMDPYPEEYSPAEQFHFACAKKNYFFGVTPEPYTFYEWLVTYNGVVLLQDTANSINFITPTNADLSQNVFYGSQPFPFPTNTEVNRLLKQGTKETNYLGNLVNINVRKMNILGDVSLWSTYKLGVVPTPEFSNLITTCYENDVLLESKSITQPYLSYIPENSIRTSRWDVDNNSSWDIITDSSLYNVSVPLKKVDMSTQVIDSSKLFMYDKIANTWSTEIIPSTDVVCYSPVVSTFIVRKPVVVIDHSEVDTVLIGTAVRSIPSGDYYNPNTDSVSWQWNDGSSLYFGDTSWHYLNDLGAYSLSYNVVDTFGCVDQGDYINAWFVPGTLNVESMQNETVKFYPNPAVSILKTDVSYLDVLIYDEVGKLVYSGAGNEFNLNHLRVGLYYLRYSSDSLGLNGVVKIVKKDEK